MKAASILCPESGITGVSGGRVHRHHKENEEIQMYLSKLKDLVPFMPKNRKLSRVEVIQHVIDYICQLENALETCPTTNSSAPAFDAAAAAAALGPRRSQGAVSPRQPLGLRASPNTILAPSEAPIVQNTTTPEKLSPSDGRPVSSC